MIYWFSATGNSEHTATHLAELLHEETMEITHSTEIVKDSRMIFVIPLYFWTLPIIVQHRRSDHPFQRTAVLFT